MGAEVCLIPYRPLWMQEGIKSIAEYLIGFISCKVLTSLRSIVEVVVVVGREVEFSSSYAP